MVLKLKLAEQKQQEKQTWGGRFLSSPKKADSDDEEGENESSPLTGQKSATKSQSNATFWIIALLVLVLSGVAGFLLVN